MQQDSVVAVAAWCTAAVDQQSWEPREENSGNSSHTAGRMQLECKRRYPASREADGADTPINCQVKETLLTVSDSHGTSLSFRLQMMEIRETQKG